MPVIEFESGGFYDGDIDKAMEEAQQKSVDEALEGFPVSAEHVHLMSGYPDQLLPALARKIDAGLVVMGSIARNALQRIFIGSTTEKVLDKLPCDLLVLKPLWFECQIPIRLEKHPAGYASERDVGAGNDSDKMNPV